MADHMIHESVTVAVPSGYRATPEMQVVRHGRGGARLPSGRVPKGGAPPSDTGLLEALAHADFTVVGDPFILSADTDRRRRQAGPARVQVEVPADHDAVLLVEQDGVYSWRTPTGRSAAAAPPGARRSPTDRRVAVRTVEFSVDLVGSESAEARTRGWLSDMVFSRVRVLVLSYVARRVVGSIVSHLESGIRPQLRQISGPNPSGWTPVTQLTGMPTDRPPRLLLLVHGTFSSTIGGFGALGGSAAGRRFLSDAAKHYDVILGYDHRTLSVDPVVNATDLLAALRGLSWPLPPVIDVVCHSRGALVTRSLVESVLPQSGWSARFERIVFVGGVNAGTELARPANWKRLMDLYTNLVAAAARLLPSPVAALVFSEVVKGIGVLVKASVSYSVDEEGVPGLAAMEPDGRFVKDLNAVQEGQPLPHTTPWFVIGGQFEPTLRGPDAPPLPKRLLLALADLGADQLMRQANDLVVHTASMGAIDAPVGMPSAFVQDQYEFPPEAGVFHTVYFSQQATLDHLGEWLGVYPRAPRLRRVRRSQAAAPPGLTPERDMTSLGPSLGRAPSYGWGVDYGGGGAYFDVDGFAPVLLEPELPLPPRTRPRTAARPAHRPGSAATAGRGTRNARGASAGRGTPRKATASAAATPPTTTTAFLRASMPATSPVGAIVTVRVTIGREELEAIQGRLSKQTKVAGVRQDRPVTVQVVVKAHAEVVGDDRVDIPLPSPGDPQDLFFDVRALATGAGLVHVVARQGPVAMATLVLEPTFIDAGHTSTETEAGTVVADAADGLPPRAPTTCVKQWLRITERAIGPHTVYDFELEAGDLEVLARGTSAPLDAESRQAYVDRIYRHIEERFVATEGDRAAFEAELKAFGGELWDELVPPEIGELLWTHRERLRNVLILSDEPFIPWEIVHLKNGRRLPREPWFLARLGSMRWFQGSYPPAHLSMSKVRYVVPEYADDSLRLPAVASEKAFLVKTLGAKAIPATSQKVLDAVATPGRFDVLHFAGHGEAEHGSARILLAGRIDDDQYVVDDLSDTTLGQYANLLSPRHPRPLVVLNACQVGRREPKLTRVGGFAKAFLAAGAGAFISSAWSVVDQPATDFTRTLYTSLLSGATLADATVAARDAARDSDGEATWLAYVVYGNPCATVRLD